MIKLAMGLSYPFVVLLACDQVRLCESHLDIELARNEGKLTGFIFKTICEFSGKRISRILKNALKSFTHAQHDQHELQASPRPKSGT